jgi:hypothetical protein
MAGGILDYTEEMAQNMQNWFNQWVHKKFL